jgi:hypothetical protein
MQYAAARATGPQNLLGAMPFRSGWCVVVQAPFVPPGKDRHVIAQDFGDPVSVRAQVLAIRKRGNAGHDNGTAENPDCLVANDVHAPLKAEPA